MTELFRRVASLEVQRADGVTVSVESARIAFEVKRDDTLHANMADLRVWNLAAGDRARLTLPSVVTLNAGFGDTSGVLFRGAVYDVAHALAGADIVTALKALDHGAGTVKVSRKGPVAWTVAATAVAQATADACGVRLGNALASIGAATGPTYPRGYSCVGPAMRELGKVLTAGGLRVSVQCGELLVLADGDALGPGQVVALDASSGLVGWPVLAAHRAPGSPPPTAASPAKGHQIKALLQPRVVPGVMVAVSSTPLSGQFRVRNVAHSGDTEGTEWFSTIEVCP